MALRTWCDQGKLGRRGDTELQKQRHSGTGVTKRPHSLRPCPGPLKAALGPGELIAHCGKHSTLSQKAKVAKQVCVGGGGELGKEFPRARRAEGQVTTAY